MGQRPPCIIKSAQMVRLHELVQRVAASRIPVLLVGETGVGKEIVAEMLHEASPRAGREMVRVNCAALPKDIIEGELFGCAKGAYTGATADRDGLFMAAHRSTIFLDELSEMALDLQTRFLRVLQEGKVRPVGKTSTQEVDVRVIASLSCAPTILMQDHRLREDLYFRICTVMLVVPPLRERVDDILPLAEAYLAYFCAELERPPMTLADETKVVLRQAPWPGNVRQLVNEMNRVAVIREADIVAPDHLSGDLQASLVPLLKLTLLEKQERAAIITTLRSHRGNKLATAHTLGIGRQTLYNKLEGYAIQPADYHPYSRYQSISA